MIAVAEVGILVNAVVRIGFRRLGRWVLEDVGLQKAAQALHDKACVFMCLHRYALV